MREKEQRGRDRESLTLSDLRWVGVCVCVWVGRCETNI